MVTETVCETLFILFYVYCEQCLTSVILLISVVVYEREADGCMECVPFCSLLNSCSRRALFTNSLAGKCDSVGERQQTVHMRFGKIAKSDY